ncbi:hypothetical protein TNCV_3595071 [Trichonephila clavipes]|nr:hypothetical protein TNCV_3595071 [Trichonephila clavipes]
MNLDTSIDDGMEQSLPSSATSSRHSSRPEMPIESTCKRRQNLNHTAKVYSEGVTTTKRTIEGYRRNGHEDDNPLIIDQLRQLAAYEEYVQRAPRCLKYGEVHQTSECQIKRVDTMYCINCNVYGHMANYSKRPLYQKPKKGSAKTNYTNVINSLVRSNVTFTQATQNKKAPSTSTIPQQKTKRVEQVPLINQTQTHRPTKSKSLK